MQPPGVPFVGRREEMAVLEDEFARAAAGEFRVVLLSGKAGVGKSRLGRELLARHPDAAGTFARAHPLGATAAFAVWTDAIESLLRVRSDGQVTATRGALLDDLASLFHRVAVFRGRCPTGSRRCPGCCRPWPPCCGTGPPRRR